MRRRPYYFEDRGSQPESHVPLPFKPETHEDDPRPEFIVELVRAINETNDVVFRTGMAEYLDLRKFIRHVAVEMFLADTDDFLGESGWPTSTCTGSRPRSYSRSSRGTRATRSATMRASIWHNITDVPSSQRNRLMARALSFPDLYDLYLDTLMECADRRLKSPQGRLTGAGGSNARSSGNTPRSGTRS